MKSTFKVLFYLKRDKQKKDGRIPLMCRITIDGKESRFGMKIDVLETQWSVPAGKAIGKSKEVNEINNLLEQAKASLFKVYNELLVHDNNVTSEKVKNQFLGFETKKQTLLELYSKHINDVEKLVGISKSKATLQKYKVTLSHLTNFIRTKYNVTDISLKDINHMFINDFEVYMMTTGKCGINTTAKFMQFLRRIILIAKNNGWILADPFASYKIQTQKVDRGYLTQSEIEKIIKKKFETPRLEYVRDIFIFACFTGLAYVDVKNLRKINICKSFDNNLWIMTKRMKTNINVNVPLMEIPQRIIDKYQDTLSDGHILPTLSNQKMNSYLKEIADLCEIKKRLTFHVARHHILYFYLKTNELREYYS